MDTLTPIASWVAELQVPRLTTFVDSAIADPEKDSLLRSFATGMEHLERELSTADAVEEKPEENTPGRWEPHWIHL